MNRSRRLVIFALATALALAGTFTMRTAAAGSCTGTNACFQSQFLVGADSCNGSNACMQMGWPSLPEIEQQIEQIVVLPTSWQAANVSLNINLSTLPPQGTVGNQSCNGENACFQSRNVVGNGSCNGVGACRQLRVDFSVHDSGIGNNSCNGDGACVNAIGPIGDCQFNLVPIAGCVPPAFVGAASRKVHGSAGTFDLPLSGVPANPTTEPRQGPTQTIQFTFDKPLNAATVTITEGTAAAGVPTLGGNDVIVPLTGVTDAQYVTVSLTNVVSSDGVSGGSGSARVGFLAGDVNGNRVVTLADLLSVNAALAQAVGPSNFLRDANLSGTLTLADKLLVNSKLTKSLPAP